MLEQRPLWFQRPVLSICLIAATSSGVGARVHARPRGRLTTLDTPLAEPSIQQGLGALGAPDACVLPDSKVLRGGGYKHALSPSLSPQHPRSEARGATDPKEAGCGAHLPLAQGSYGDMQEGGQGSALELELPDLREGTVAGE